MNNKNLLLGIAAGAAALVVIGLIARKSGALDSLLEKICELADAVEDKFADLEKFGLDDVIPKGEDSNVSNTATKSN